MTYTRVLSDITTSRNSKNTALVMSLLEKPIPEGMKLRLDVVPDGEFKRYLLSLVPLEEGDVRSQTVELRG